MSRRKGEITGHMNERDFPHLVELELPPRAGERHQQWRHRESRSGRGIAPPHAQGSFFSGSMSPSITIECHNVIFRVVHVEQVAVMFHNDCSEI
jgi:hypothetical protein